ncbi:YchJ family metal-binding protein [Flavobacterium sp. 20NA77.7]|uniref:YchJ family metal-binding protein n=1 Tax=Flavobacterium nakdongensis TaxID=3073563 RepID=A0ABY9R8S0_9FLAO|nr:YchJ family metal-binding protein [Flavobacterium sp. 20NA77.7]WMW76980.1 YchJ family metal-binding protein [Flavobacterium sp. 20NA77.7]
MTNCPCGSLHSLETCCLPYINKEKQVPTAECLMRSRYTAYTLHAASYLFDTTAPLSRRFTSKKAILAWAAQNTWVKLDVVDFTETTVTFKAYYFDHKGYPQEHYEKSSFCFQEGCWFYVDGVFY